MAQPGLLSSLGPVPADASSGRSVVDTNGFVSVIGHTTTPALPQRELASLLADARLVVLQPVEADTPSLFTLTIGKRLDRDQSSGVLVRSFAASHLPAPPSSIDDSGESARPWSVIASGAATGFCWNEPAMYQVQAYLSLGW